MKNDTPYCKLLLYNIGKMTCVQENLNTIPIILSAIVFFGSFDCISIQSNGHLAKVCSPSINKTSQVQNNISLFFRWLRKCNNAAQNIEVQQFGNPNLIQYTPQLMEVAQSSSQLICLPALNKKLKTFFVM